MGLGQKFIHHKMDAFASFYLRMDYGFNWFSRKMTKTRTLICPKVAYAKMKMHTLIILFVHTFAQIFSSILFYGK